MCVAMAALEATIQVQGPRGSRAILIGDFHLLPGNTPHRETVLEPGDLITHVTLPASLKTGYTRYLTKDTPADGQVSVYYANDLLKAQGITVCLKG